MAAARLWDSCFHALGRTLIDPSLAWEFLASMLDTQDPSTGHIPIQYQPWNDNTNNLTQPPLLAWATWDNYQVGLCCHELS